MTHPYLIRYIDSKNYRIDTERVAEPSYTEIQRRAMAGHYDMVEIYLLKDMLSVDCTPIEMKEKPEPRRIPTNVKADSFTRASSDMLKILSEHTNDEVKMSAIKELRRRELEE